MDCIFCRIARGEIPAKVVAQDADVMAFEDIHPQAPVHVLVIPKKHIATLADAADAEAALLGKMSLMVRDVAVAKGVAEAGYRVITNVRKMGGQEVFHLHAHVLGGRPLGRMLGG